MNPKFSLPVLLFLSILFSCSHGEKQQAAMDTTLSKIEMSEPSSPDKTEGKQQIPLGNPQRINGDTTNSQFPTQTAPHIDWDKKIIKTGTVRELLYRR